MPTPTDLPWTGPISPLLNPFRSIWDAYIAPLSKDEDARRREYILNIVLATSIIGLLLLEFLIVLHLFLRGGTYSGISPFVFALFPLFSVLLYVLSRKGHHVVASYLLIAALFCGTIYACIVWGIDLPIALLSYAFIIAVTSILLGMGMGFIATLVTAGLLTAIWNLHIHGAIPLHHQHPSEDDVIAFSVLYFLIMTVSWLSNREIAKSLSRARQSEKALTRERDMLEIRVEERTDELRRAQFDELQKMHRLAEFGSLSSGLFHDLLNILTALSLRTEDNSEEDPSLAETHETTRQVQHFMRAVQGQLGRKEVIEPFSLEDTIDEVIQLVTYKANKERVRILFERKRHNIFLYTGIQFKFHHIVMNLLTNAIDAYNTIPPDEVQRRTIHVYIDRRRDDIILTVSDEGSGIPLSVRDRIFTPFFTTKSDSQGAGIGLATIKKIIEEDFSGTIEFRTIVGTGTTFIVTFPTTPPHHETTPSSTRIHSRHRPHR